MKKLLAGLLSTILFFASFSMTTFAEEEQIQDLMPDVIVSVTVDNSECKELEHLETLSLVITKKSDQTKIAEIPLEASVDEEGMVSKDTWAGMAMDAISDDIMEELKSLQGEFDLDIFDDVENAEGIETFTAMEEEIEDILKDYEVTVAGASDHYTVTSSGMVLTSEIMDALVDLFKDLFGEAMKEQNPDYVIPDSFSQLMKDFLDASGLTQEDLTGLLGEGIEFDENIWKELDEVIDYLCGESYKGTLVVGASLECECETTVEYEIIHEYYKVKGNKKELVGKANYGTVKDEEFELQYYEGKKGDVIKASDYVNCEYEGVTYQYVGSYEYFEEYELEEFVLSPEFDAPYGLILKYEIEVDEPIKDDSEDDKTEKDDHKNPEIKVEDDHQVAAKTEDQNQIWSFIPAIAGAIAGMMFVVISRRKKR